MHDRFGKDNKHLLQLQKSFVDGRLTVTGAIPHPCCIIAENLGEPRPDPEFGGWYRKCRRCNAKHHSEPLRPRALRLVGQGNENDL